MMSSYLMMLFLVMTLIIVSQHECESGLSAAWGGRRRRRGGGCCCTCKCKPRYCRYQQAAVDVDQHPAHPKAGYR